MSSAVLFEAYPWRVSQGILIPELMTNKKATARVAVSFVMVEAAGRSRPSLAFAALMYPCISESESLSALHGFRDMKTSCFQPAARFHYCLLIEQ